MSLLVSIFFVFSTTALELGQKPDEIVLSEKQGGTLAGEPWSSSSLQGKVHVLFYVDPDEKDLNEPLSEAFRASDMPEDQVSFVAVINMAATWLPNWGIRRALRKKQEKYQRTLYVKDKKKVLVKEWGLEDDNNCVYIFDPKGIPYYQHCGQVSEQEIPKVIELVQSRFPRNAPQ